MRISNSEEIEIQINENGDLIIDFNDINVDFYIANQNETGLNIIKK